MRHIANALLLVGMLWAAQGQARDKTMDFRGMTFSTDPRQFVERMLYLHGEIIDEGRMAQRSSQSQQVKEFSETLVRAHQSFDDRLKTHLKEQKLKSGAFTPRTN